MERFSEYEIANSKYLPEGGRELGREGVREGPIRDIELLVGAKNRDNLVNHILLSTFVLLEWKRAPQHALP